MGQIKDKRKFSEISILLAALIWGFSYIAQAEGAKYVGPFFFNAIRYAIGILLIFPMILLRNKMETGEFVFWQDWEDKKMTFKGAFIDGFLLFFAMTFQQIGVSLTDPGKAGFLTSLSIVMVPVFGLFVGEKISKKQWLAIFLAFLGIAIMSFNLEGKVNIGDILIICCAMFFALSLMVSGHYNKEVESFKFTMLKFIVPAVFSGLLTMIFEKNSLSDIKPAIPAILYAGIFASGFACTFQSLGQIHLDNLSANLIMSLEYVFAAVFSWMIGGKSMSNREILGCIILFSAVLFIQIFQEKDKNI